MYSATAKDENLNTVKDTARNIKSEANDTVRDLKTVANSAGRSVRNLIDSASTEVANASDTVMKQIRNKPVQSSAIALGVGFVLGALLRR